MKQPRSLAAALLGELAAVGLVLLAFALGALAGVALVVVRLLGHGRRRRARAKHASDVCRRYMACRRVA